MIDVKQIAKRKNSGSGGSSASGSGFGPIGKIAEEAKHAARADKAAFAEQTDYANRAGYAAVQLMRTRSAMWVKAVHYMIIFCVRTRRIRRRS